jgi:hypothetical protein
MPTTTTTMDRLRVMPVTGTAWRVSDPQVGHDDPFGVIGFVVLCDGLFEVTQLDKPYEWHYFATMYEAMDDLQP